MAEPVTRMPTLQLRIQSVLDERVGTGAETGLQVSVHHQGVQVVDAVAGVADSATGRRVAPDTLFFSFSMRQGRDRSDRSPARQERGRRVRHARDRRLAGVRCPRQGDGDAPARADPLGGCRRRCRVTSVQPICPTGHGSAPRSPTRSRCGGPGPGRGTTRTPSVSSSARSRAGPQADRCGSSCTSGSPYPWASRVTSSTVCPGPSCPGRHGWRTPHRPRHRDHPMPMPYSRPGSGNRPRRWGTTSRSSRRTSRRSAPSPHGASPP